MPVSNPGIIASGVVGGTLPTLVADGNILIDHNDDVLSTHSGHILGYVDPYITGEYTEVKDYGTWVRSNAGGAYFSGQVYHADNFSDMHRINVSTGDRTLVDNSTGSALATGLMNYAGEVCSAVNTPDLHYYDGDVWDVLDDDFYPSNASIASQFVHGGKVYAQTFATSAVSPNRILVRSSVSNWESIDLGIGNINQIAVLYNKMYVSTDGEINVKEYSLPDMEYIQTLSLSGATAITAKPRILVGVSDGLLWFQYAESGGAPGFNKLFKIL